MMENLYKEFISENNNQNYFNEIKNERSKRTIEIVSVQCSCKCVYILRLLLHF